MENVNLLPENEYTEVDGRRYLNPNLPVERTNAFIDNLRTAQQANTQQINTDTQNLGTDVPSDLGGLTGAGSYFTSRYQTPQTNTVVQNLRTAAQADALNQMLQNEQEMWKKKYQDAYRAHQKRSYDKTYNSKGGNSGGNNGNSSGWNGEIDEETTDGGGGYTSESYLTVDETDMAPGKNYKFIVQPGSGNIIRIDDSVDIKDPGYEKIYYLQKDGSYKANDGSTI